MPVGGFYHVHGTPSYCTGTSPGLAHWTINSPLGRKKGSFAGERDRAGERARAFEKAFSGSAASLNTERLKITQNKPPRKVNGSRYSRWREAKKRRRGKLGPQRSYVRSKESSLAKHESNCTTLLIISRYAEAGQVGVPSALQE